MNGEIRKEKVEWREKKRIGWMKRKGESRLDGGKRRY